MIDTLTYANTLKKSGVPAEMAKGHALALKNVIDQNIALKSDLKQLATKREVRKLGHEMQKLELRIIVKLGSVVVVTSTLMLAIIAILMKM